MESKVPDTVSTIRRLIAKFNQRAVSSPAYPERKKAPTTPTVFFDYEGDAFPNLVPSADGWCTIPEDLAARMEESPATPHIIEFVGEEQSPPILSQEFYEECKAEVPKYMKSLAYLYLSSYYTLADDYEPSVRERVKAASISLNKDIESDKIIWDNYSSIVDFLKAQMKAAKDPEPGPKFSGHRKPSRKEITSNVQELQRARIHSVRDICDLCHISPWKYYALCREMKPREEVKEEAKREPGVRTRLNEDQVQFIKRLADTPYRSYTAPEISAEIHDKYGIQVGRKAVYYQLTRKLGYSYQRNHFKYPPSFSRGQIPLW